MTIESIDEPQAALSGNRSFASRGLATQLIRLQCYEGFDVHHAVYDEEIVEETLGVVLKYQDDVEKVRGEAVTMMLNRVRAGV